MRAQHLLSTVCACRLGNETIAQRMAIRPEALHEWSRMRTGSDSRLKAIKAFAKAALALHELDKLSHALHKDGPLVAVASASEQHTASQALAVLPSARPVGLPGQRRVRDIGTQTGRGRAPSFPMALDPPAAWSSLPVAEQFETAQTVWIQRWRAVFSLLLRAVMLTPLVAYVVVAAGLLYLVLRPEMLVFAFVTLVGNVLSLFPTYLHLIMARSADRWTAFPAVPSPAPDSPPTVSPSPANLSQPIIIQIPALTQSEPASGLSDQIPAAAFAGLFIWLLRRFEPHHAV
jgi:hypothetical protein